MNANPNSVRESNPEVQNPHPFVSLTGGCVKPVEEIEKVEQAEPVEDVISEYEHFRVQIKARKTTLIRNYVYVCKKCCGQFIPIAQRNQKMKCAKCGKLVKKAYIMPRWILW